MIKNIRILFLIAGYSTAAAQQAEPVVQQDTLNEVMVEAYQYGRPVHEVPVSIGQLGTKELERFSNTSLLPAVNTIPGVRMEERSPASYRLSIRGSTLRSPFGVRNVKVYWNDLPFSDPGGNTYLNLLDLSSISQAEVIKGPAGSLYGAGTGGVVLLKGPRTKPGEAGIGFSGVGGSFGLRRYTVSAQGGAENAGITAQYAHQQSDGYREQTSMRRDVVQVQGHFRTSEHRLVQASVLYTDLFYQIPGGLTEDQFNENPKQARQPAGPNPGAVTQRTAIYNKTFFTGISHHYQWNKRWSNRTGVYGSFTRFENPFITNYEKRTELGLGGRSDTHYDFAKGELNFGVEFQHGFSPIHVYDNNGGTSGALQNSDEIASTSSLLFAQAEFFLPGEFYLTAGASLNFFNVQYTRLSDTPPFEQEKDFDPVVSPRIALLKKINDRISAYGSVARGFSPPTVAELYPSTSVFNNDLNPEKGTNFEAGTRGGLLNGRLGFDLTAYAFYLDETIVVRRNDDGDDFFVNAGKTRQQGLELQLSWRTSFAPRAFLSAVNARTSATLNRYRFAEYIKDTDDYSDNKLTGVPPVVLVAGIDLETRPGIYTNITLSYTDEIPLNDANTVFAGSYVLLNARIGYSGPIAKKLPVNIFAGVDNALDERYSLGNDLNAFGGRYFNAAPPVNFYFGISGNVRTKQNTE